MPNGFTSPAEIARETLRKLAVERIQPTPDNFRTHYHRIAGTAADDAFPARSLAAIVADLPRSNAQALQFAGQFERAVESGQWPLLRETLHDLVRLATAPPPAWATLVRELVAGLDGVPAAAVATRRRAELQRILASGSHDGQALFARLRGLVNEWLRSPHSGHGDEPDDTPGAGVAPEAPAGALARLIRRAIVPFARGPPGLGVARETLAAALEAAGDREALDAATAGIEALAARLEWLGEDQRAIRDALAGLLRLIVDNIGELVIEDRWLHGQAAAIGDLFARPLDVRVLDEAERRLREVIGKQQALRRHLDDAQRRLQAMLSGFLSRLAEITDTTGAYHATLGRFAVRIAEARGIDELSAVVETMLEETRSVHEATGRTTAELQALQQQVAEANQRIAAMQHELDETSELLRHDALTGVLNRRGIDEALAREIARCRRRGESLCLAVLDLDNFKEVNDRFGHQVGDAALQHLTAVVRDCLRPQDTVGRYGGEEFVILLPEAKPTASSAILTRLQRELTRRYFLTGNQRLLITFSAGITQIAADEDPQQALDRADRAMYAAKRAGKNRVLIAG
jgi:diguanylate cyclase